MTIHHDDLALIRLKHLRGAHDQTMRTQTIEIVYGGDPNRAGPTATERFLESEIARLEHKIRLREIEQGAL